MLFILTLACVAKPGPGRDAPDTADDTVFVQLTRDDDYDPVGSVDRHYSYTHDAQNRTSVAELDGSDGSPDGSVDERWVYTYADDGTELLIDDDAGADGTTDDRDTLYYDASGNNIGFDEDDGADGIVDRHFTRTFDEEGHQLTGSYDSDGDGTWDVLVTYDWDEDGNNVAMNYDGDADGAFTSDGDVIVTYMWEDGLRVTDLWWFPTTSGYSYQYEYDSTGTLTSSDERLDDGTVVYTSTYSYDNGDLIRVDTDYSSSSSRTIYAYDEHHNQILYERDDDADGTPSLRQTWTWACASGA